MQTNVALYFREFARLDMQRVGEGLSVLELERWSILKHTLDRELRRRKAQPSDERRSSRRVAVRLNCSYASSDHLRNAVITNVNTGGVFVETKTPLPIGSSLELRIRIEESGAEIEAQGVVVTQNIGPELRSATQGMGVRFTEVKRDFIEEFSALYAHEVSREVAVAERR